MPYKRDELLLLVVHTARLMIKMSAELYPSLSARRILAGENVRAAIEALTSAAPGLGGGCPARERVDADVRHPCRRHLSASKNAAGSRSLRVFPDRHALCAPRLSDSTGPRGCPSTPNWMI